MTHQERAVLLKVLWLELTLLPRLKGLDEKRVRELIWLAHDALKAEKRGGRKLDNRGRRAPSAVGALGLVYSASQR